MSTDSAPADFPLRLADVAPMTGPHRRATSESVPILVIDDEPLIRWSCAETLKASGFRVIEGERGETAVAVLANPNGGAEVVLLDLILPDARDLSLLARLRRLVPAVPIVLMTAFPTPELVAEAERLGAFAVVEKPFDLNELVPLVCRALASRPSP
jgi:two-component system nitrogen regulation response regulator GlnG